MSVGNHAHHRLVSQCREMRVIRWRVKDGVVDYFHGAFSLIHRNSREEAGNLFCQSELIFYIKHNGIGVFFAVNAATGIKKGKNTQRGCAFLPFCLVRACFPRCQGPPPFLKFGFQFFRNGGNGKMPYTQDHRSSIETNSTGGGKSARIPQRGNIFEKFQKYFRKLCQNRTFHSG